MLTMDYLRLHLIPKVSKGDLYMAEKVFLYGNTQEEVRKKADELIATIDPYRQPSIMSVYERTCGDWVATIVYYGLD